MRQLTFGDVAHRLVGDNARFVQVGSFDGLRADHLRHYVLNHGWRGVCVEPIPDSMKELKQNCRGIEGLQFVQAAIWTEPGQREIHYVPYDLHYTGGVPLSVLASSSFWDRHVPDMDGRRKTITVECLTLEQLFEKTNTTAFDVFHCDAEGADYEIIKTLDLDKWKPILAQVESKAMTEPQIAECEALFASHGYGTSRRRADLLAWRLDVEAAAEEAG